MRYLILLIFSCTLIFSCGTESENAPAKTKTSANTQRPKPAKAAKGKRTKIKTNSAKFWGYMKKNVGLKDTQVANIKKVRKKYNDETQKLKKSGKWVGKDNLANRKNINAKKQAELKKIIGASSWTKWTAANKSYSEKYAKDAK